MKKRIISAILACVVFMSACGSQTGNTTTSAPATEAKTEATAEKVEETETEEAVAEPSESPESLSNSLDSSSPSYHMMQNVVVPGETVVGVKYKLTDKNGNVVVEKELDEFIEDNDRRFFTVSQENIKTDSGELWLTWILNDGREVENATNPVDVTFLPGNSTETAAENNSGSQNTQYPDLVSSLYEAYKSKNQESGADLSIGNMKVDKDNPVYDGVEHESIYYSFKIENSDVTIRYWDDDYSSYDIDLSDKESNETLKNIIALAISASEGIEYQDATEIMQSFVNSFNGKGQSEALLLNKYRYLLEQVEYSLFSYLKLYIEPRDQSAGFNKEDYPPLNAEYMQGALNQGEFGYISGKVVKDSIKDYTNELEIENDEGRFLLFYNPAKFAGEFEVSETYTFYGQIAKNRDGYDGCLRIDFYE